MARMAGFTELSIILPDGYRAYARYWSPAAPQGAVLYHHGIQSHCGWYETSPARLREAGFAVLQVDRRGSGRNAEDRGHAESADQLIGDTLAARDELLRRSGRAEYHLIGVSWGGKLAVATYATAPNGVRSVSLVTPGLFPRVGVSKTEQTKIGFSMLYEPRKSFEIPLNDPDLFTVNPQWREFFRADPLTLRQCTAAFYLASRRMDKLVQRFPRAAPLPVHLMVAGDERIIDNDATGSFVRELGWPHCRITTYPRSRHSVEFEPDSETYFGDLVGFLADVDGRCRGVPPQTPFTDRR